ncbi:MAG: hypothetical protein ABI599_13535 [Flavobacteriales bacterium]
MQLRTLFPFLLSLAALHASALEPMPDANLRSWVNNNFPGAIVGTNIDETNPAVQTATSISLNFINNVTNLMGMQVFVNATLMDVSNNAITTWMGPQSLQTLIANNCGITGTFVIPLPIHTMLVSYNAISTLDLSVAGQIQYVNASHNQITTLTGLSSSTLTQLNLSYNPLAAFPANAYLPNLQTLDISHDLFTAVPYTANQMVGLNASYNLITTMDQLHGSNNGFTADLSHNAIDWVPGTATARTINLSFNPITQGIAQTSYVLESLTITNTQLPCLPYLHNALGTLYCTNSLFTCLPNQPPNLLMSAVNFGFPPAVCTSNDPCFMPLPSIAVKVYLQGPYDFVNNSMRDDLRAQGLLPNAEPYTALGFNYTGIPCSETLAPALFAQTGTDAIVDWVVVDMFVDNGVINPGDAEHYSRPALVQRDGDVVGLDGSSPLELDMRYGSYRTAVRHRNHLGAIVKFGAYFGAATPTVDLTSYSATACFFEAMHGDSTLLDNRQLWSGDVTFNHQIKYVGAGNDRDPILQTIGGLNPLNVVSGVYSSSDVNMDGKVKYTGVDNDRDPILVNIGGINPTLVRNQVAFQ